MHEYIRNTLQPLGLALVLVSTTASAGVWVGGGIDYHTTGQYLDYSSGGANKYLDEGRETGFIPFVEASADVPVTEKARLAVSGRAYGGNVDFGARSNYYTGNTTVKYSGMRAEAGMRYRPMPHGENSDLVFVGMLGYDTFTRKVSSVNEKQEWKMPFLRLGVDLEPNEGSPWAARGGLLIPMHTLVRDDVWASTWEPEAAVSFYLGFGRRFTRFVEAGLNYEAIRISNLNPKDKVFAWPRIETDSYQFYLKVGI